MADLDAALIATPETDNTNALSERPGFLIRRMHQIHLALFAEECAAFDITPVQYSIMTVAGAQPKLDQAKLAYEVGVDRATLANVVARLEEKGFIKRSPCSTDKRLKLVSLTTRGATLLKKMHAPVQRAHDRTLEALPPASRVTLKLLLKQLVDAQNDYGRAPLRLS
jgi:MarR family transcriptional regulator, lower aerobic nicotinate degradation pathway regulator